MSGSIPAMFDEAAVYVVCYYAIHSANRAQIDRPGLSADAQAATKFMNIRVRLPNIFFMLWKE